MTRNSQWNIVDTTWNSNECTTEIKMCMSIKHTKFPITIWNSRHENNFNRFFTPAAGVRHPICVTKHILDGFMNYQLLRIYDNKIMRIFFDDRSKSAREVYHCFKLKIWTLIILFIEFHFWNFWLRRIQQNLAIANSIYSLFWGSAKCIWENKCHLYFDCDIFPPPMHTACFMLWANNGGTDGNITHMVFRILPLGQPK